MARTGDRAPAFTAPVATGEITQFTLDDRLPAEAPLALAFFPGAFTDVCCHELSTFQERIGEIEDAGATLYGVSVDTPFALEAFRDELGLEFGLISDNNRRLVEAYDVTMDYDHIGLEDVAKRAVFVIDADGTIVYDWVTDDPGREPDYDDVIAALA